MLRIPLGLIFCIVLIQNPVKYQALRYAEHIQTDILQGFELVNHLFKK